MRYPHVVDLISLTRQLVDIESISGNESRVGEFILDYLSTLGFHARAMQVGPNRFNIVAVPPEQQRPSLYFSTHMDTVPPFIASSEDDGRIYGRGAGDAKGILAAQIAAAVRLREAGYAAGLLFLVGEERDSLGAKVANEQAPPEVRYLVNGEPTENRLAIASKGALRVEVVAKGRTAHSAYPELGDSAIHKLLDALAKLRAMPLSTEPEVGPATMNIGVIEGGHAPNVIPDYARAQLLYRLVGPSTELRRQIVEAVGDLAQVEFVLEIPFVRLRSMPDFGAMTAAFTTDIPALNHWGQPLLLGPSSIHVAHTQHEYVDKAQLHEAVDLYVKIAKQLLET